MAARAMAGENNTSNGVKGVLTDAAKDKSVISFKVKITGLPSSYALEDLKKLLSEELKVPFTQLHVLPAAANIALLTLNTEEEVEQAVKTIDKFKWWNNDLVCVKATFADLKRKHGEGPEGVGGKKARQLSSGEKAVCDVDETQMGVDMGAGDSPYCNGAPGELATLQAVPVSPSPAMPQSGTPASGQPGPQSATQSNANPLVRILAAGPVRQRESCLDEADVMDAASKLSVEDSKQITVMENDDLFPKCSVPQCSTMKDASTHVRTCNVDNCPFPYCWPIRQLRSHSQKCARSDCIVRYTLQKLVLENNRLQILAAGPVPHWDSCLDEADVVDALSEFSLQDSKEIRSTKIDELSQKLTKCRVPECSGFTKVSKHMIECHVDKCPFPYCWPARQLHDHEINCARKECVVRQPMKQGWEDSRLLLRFQPKCALRSARVHQRKSCLDKADVLDAASKLSLQDFNEIAVTEIHDLYQKIKSAQCRVLECSRFRKLFKHMSECHVDKCRIRYCWPARQLRDHKLECVRKDCIFCQPMERGREDSRFGLLFPHRKLCLDKADVLDAASKLSLQVYKEMKVTEIDDLSQKSAQCRVPECSRFIKTCKHMIECHVDKCPFPYCWPARQLLDHHYKCARKDCIVYQTIERGREDSRFGFGQPGPTDPTAITVKFQVVTDSPAGTDMLAKNGETQNISTRHNCITCMKEYENESLEELRLEDYMANRKGPPNPIGGMFAATDIKNLCGQSSNMSGESKLYAS